MIRMRYISVLLSMVGLLLILSGCFGGEKSLKEIDPPVDMNERNDEDHLEENESNQLNSFGELDPTDEMIPLKLYLMDVNGLIAEQTIELPLLETKEVAKQVLTYLVKGGPITPILPNGFQATLPEGTEVLGMNLLEDGTLIIDLSEEFQDYRAEDELKILQSMTYTLTQFENIDRIKLRINGHPQKTMPVNGTPIEKGYARSNGINISESGTVDLLNSQAVTMYFPAEYHENRYYVPVTTYVPAGKDADLITATVQSLLKGPDYSMNLTHVFNTDTELIERPVLSDGVLELVFNEDILLDPVNHILSDEVVETLVRTLTEHDEIEALELKVENVEMLLNENGEAYNEPVTAQSVIEKGRF